MDELVKRWQTQYKDFYYVPVVEETNKSWPGKTGQVPNAVVHDHSDLSGFDLYMAGPPAMIDKAKTVFLAHRLIEDRLFCDPFLPGHSHSKKTKSFFASRIQRIFK